MVTAIRSGPSRKRLRQRAASASSAVESGPPDTASSSARAAARSAKSASASASETGWSAVGMLLFPLGRLLHVVGRARVLAGHFIQGRARKLALVEGCQRLPEAQQGVGSLGMAFVLLRHVEKRRGGISVVLTLEHALAKPELRIGRQLVARMPFQKCPQCILGERVVLAQNETIAEIVLVAWRLRGRQGCSRRGPGSAGIARRRRRQRTRHQAGIACGGPRHGRKIERSAGLAAARRADLLLVGDDRRRNARHLAGRDRTGRTARIAAVAEIGTPPRCAE